MVWTQVRVDTGGVSRLLTRLILNDAKRQAMLREVGEQAVQEIQMHFINQKTPEGVPWKPSKRALADPVRPTLMNTNSLLNSIVWKVSGGQVSAGTNDIRAGTLNFGARKGQYGAARNGAPLPWGDIPARKFIGVSSGGQVKVRDVISRFLRRLE